MPPDRADIFHAGLDDLFNRAVVDLDRMRAAAQDEFSRHAGGDFFWRHREAKAIQVVYHFPVAAAAENAANILYRDIVKLCCDLTSQIPNLETDFPVEYASMQNGAVIERRRTVRFSSINLTPAQKRAEIEAQYTPFQTEVFDQLQTEWEWYGYNNDVA